MSFTCMWVVFRYSAWSTQLEMTRAFTPKNAKFDSELNQETRKNQKWYWYWYMSAPVQNPNQTQYRKWNWDWNSRRRAAEMLKRPYLLLEEISLISQAKMRKNGFVYKYPKNEEMLFKLKNYFGTKADLSELYMNKSRLKIRLMLLTSGALRFWICSLRVLGWKNLAVFKREIIKCGVCDSRAWCLLSAKAFYVLFFSVFWNLIHTSYIQDTKNHLQFQTEQIFLLETFSQFWC